jgi:hypothetical protein
LLRDAGKYQRMSRRNRTTAKMFGNRKPAKSGGPTQNRTSTLDLTGAPDGKSEPPSTDEPLTAEALERHLAAEALLREASEERTASTIARYFRLTVALAGINIVVAGATGVMLFTRSGKAPTVVAQPATSRAAASSAPAQPRAPAVPPAPAASAAPSPAALPPAPPAALPASIPPANASPLGLPPASPAKRETVAGALRTRRTVAREADESEKVVLSSVVERW